MLYRTIMAREPDPSGLESFAALIRAGTPVEVLAQMMLESDEYAQRRRIASPPFDYRATQAAPLTIVDLGAQDTGEPHAYAPLIEAGLDWRCVGFEPIAEKARERELADPSGRLVVRTSFVGDGGRWTFHLNSDSGSSSLLPLDHDFVRPFDHIGQMETLSREEVDTERLDDLLDEGPVDFLKLDIQGFELVALQGAPRTLARTNVVHSEVHFALSYEGSPYFGEVDAFLREAGFELIDLPHLTRYEYVDVAERSGGFDRLIWGEAVWFRRLDPARDDARDFWAQSAIASLVYRKHGLARKIWEGMPGGRRPDGGDRGSWG